MECRIRCVWVFGAATLYVVHHLVVNGVCLDIFIYSSSFMILSCIAKGLDHGTICCCYFCCISCIISFRSRDQSTSQKTMNPEEKTLVEILDEHNPIDLARYINYVTAPQAGAIATFSGTTRDSFEGKTVLELRYEAYKPMAIRCIKSICLSARSSWSLHSIAVAHRLGPVPVGITSVFIAISAVHRADALDACKFVIDELKASVPIWKKEVYANGEVWKENSEFLERRLELGKKDGVRGGKDVEFEGHHKKGCCGAKVKVNGGVANISTSHGWSSELE